MTISGNHPKISVVVAVYQRDDFLERVLASLESQTMGDFEILVADDGSGEAIVNVINRYSEAFNHPIQHVWHEDRGFRKTIIVNQAVARARAEYLVFIDGDCILHHRFLERHYKRRRRGQVLSGRRVMLDRWLTERLTVDDVRSGRVERISYWWKHAGKVDRWNGLYLPWLHWIRNFGRNAYQILGSNFSVHKADFLHINGYDERIIGRGLEDNNLWVRFVNSGVRVGTITREALQYHQYHSVEEIPHSREFIEQYRSSKETRTPYGIVKE